MVYAYEVVESRSTTTNKQEVRRKVYVGNSCTTNSFLSIIDQSDRRLFKKKLPNCPKAILAALRPFKKRLVGIVVESTYNWHWLVDCLNDKGYKVHLAKPSSHKAIRGTQACRRPMGFFLAGSYARRQNRGGEPVPGLVLKLRGLIGNCHSPTKARVCRCLCGLICPRREPTNTRERSHFKGFGGKSVDPEGCGKAVEYQSSGFKS